MCSYKLVTVKFEVWGLQTRVEQFVHKVRKERFMCDFFFLSDKLFDRCRWMSEPEAFHFLLWKHVTNKPVGCEPMFYNSPLKYLPPSLPPDCLAPPALTWAQQFKLHISYFPNPFRRYSICPWGELSPSSPCQRHTHTGRIITHSVPPGVTHIYHIPPGGERKHLELRNVIKTLFSHQSWLILIHILSPWTSSLRPSLFIFVPSVISSPLLPFFSLFL